MDPAVEERRIGLETSRSSGNEGESRISQNHQSGARVLSGSQLSSPAVPVDQQNKGIPSGSSANEHHQSRMPPEEHDSRPHSSATDRSMNMSGTPRQPHSRPHSIATGRSSNASGATGQPDSRPPSRATSRSFNVEGTHSPGIFTLVQAGQKQLEEGKFSPLGTLRRTPGVPSAKETDEKENKRGTIDLDAKNPGIWVVDHHLGSLIVAIGPSESPSHDGFSRWQWAVSCLKAVFGKPPQGPRRNVYDQPEPAYRVSFAEMQRMHLRKLQIGLVNHAVTMYSKKDESPDWEKDLAAYIQAIRDYDYMLECSGRERDPFLATGERYIDHYVTKRVVKDVKSRPNQHDWGKLREEIPLGPWEHDSAPIGGTRKSTLKARSFKEFWDRLLLAILGAAFLLGPMWLMVLHNTLYTGLITTTVCVSVFGLVVVFSVDKRMDVLSATAAYAAVLVVFVGLTTDSS